MNAFATFFLLVNAIALLAVPRRWAPIPLLAGACYMTLGQGVEIGPFNFPVMRLILLVGFVRVLCRREGLVGGVTGLDRLLLAWGAWAIVAGLLTQPLVRQLGLAYNTLGIYFLIRIFCRDTDDLVFLLKNLAIILVPVALEMINEQLTGRNFFGVFGGVPESVVVRGAKLRAQGPFAHAILAGTVGAACLPFMIGLWQQHRRLATFGIITCVIIVVACKSSGPVMTVLFGLFALLLWRWRQYTRHMRLAAVAAYLLLDLVMKAPAYYLLARVDLTGSSTGWHRAELIRQAIRHLDEWWFSGATYTRHWMPYGVVWSENQCDITNQYILYGVMGGLPLMLLFLLILWRAFSYVGNWLARNADAEIGRQKLVWASGVALFSQAAACTSVAYFDQSFVFLFLNLGVLGSLHASSGQITESTELDPGAIGLADDPGGTHA